MLLTDRFVFVHFLKTGGTFVKETLLEHAPKDWHCINIEGHPSVSDIPTGYRDKPCFGFVRNPWDWYASAYHYFNSVADDPLFDQISLSRTLGFSETIRRSFEIEPFGAAGVGLMTYYFKRIFPESAACEILRFESLRTDLLGYLRRLGVVVPQDLEEAILNEPPRNRSPRQPYQTYYDAQLASEIRIRDAYLANRFEYTF